MITEITKFDAIGVSYNGRPRDHFLEEVPRIMDWMEMSSHVRNPHPNEIEVEAARPVIASSIGSR